MKFFTRFIMVVVLGMCMIIPAFSQSSQDDAISDPLNPRVRRTPFFAGPVFGYNRSMHTVELKSFTEPLCPVFKNGNDNGFYAGLSFEQHIGPFETSTSSIIARVLYNTLPASMETTENPIPSLVTSATGTETVINSSTIHTQKISYSLITGEICYKLNPIAGMGLGITVGPTFDFAMTKTHDQRYSLLTPLNAQFKRNEQWIKDKGISYVDNDRTIIISQGDVPNSSGFRLGLKAGIQYEINLKGFYVVPAVYYNFGVTNLSSDENWRVNAMQMGVDIRFAI